MSHPEYRELQVPIRPKIQRLAVALQGFVVAIKDAGLAPVLAALLERRLAGVPAAGGSVSLIPCPPGADGQGSAA
jgi:hypothetical protein